LPPACQAFPNARLLGLPSTVRKRRGLEGELPRAEMRPANHFRDSGAAFLETHWPGWQLGIAPCCRIVDGSG